MMIAVSSMAALLLGSMAVVEVGAGVTMGAVEMEVVDVEVAVRVAVLAGVGMIVFVVL